MLCMIVKIDLIYFVEVRTVRLDTASCMQNAIGDEIVKRAERDGKINIYERQYLFGIEENQTQTKN